MVVLRRNKRLGLEQLLQVVSCGGTLCQSQRPDYLVYEEDTKVDKYFAKLSELFSTIVVSRKDEEIKMYITWCQFCYNELSNEYLE